MADKQMRIYQCEDSVSGVLSAVYEAGISGYGHEFIKIRPMAANESYELELFTEFVPVESSEEKVESVLQAVCNKISGRAYNYVICAAISVFPDRGDAIYQFLTYGFSMGSRVCDAMQIPWVKRIFEIRRRIYNEAHFYKEFIRFREVQKEPPLLVATIEPEHRVLPIVMEHFADRFAGEWFVILDKSHGEAAFHQKNGSWEIRILTEEQEKLLTELGEQQEEYVELWKTFFKHIAISERKNGKLQTNMLALHYRKHMTEFMEETRDLTDTMHQKP